MITLFGTSGEGFVDANENGIIDTGDMPHEPGSAEAKAHFATIQAKASKAGMYGGKSLDFGAGGRSSLLFDKLVYAQGLDPVIAKIMVGKNYQHQLALRG